MTIEQIEKIKEILEQSKSFALVLNDKFNEHELLGRHALKLALEAKGGSVCLLPENPDGFVKKWSSILPKLENFPPLKSICVSIPKDKYKIKEVSYDDNKKTFSLNVLAESFCEKDDEITLQIKPTLIDVVFCFSEKCKENIERHKNKISLNNQEKIITISKNDKIITEKIHEIISAIDENLFTYANSKISTILLASLLMEKIDQQNNSSQILELENQLLESGADKKTVNKIMSDFLPVDYLPIS